MSGTNHLCALSDDQPTPQSRKERNTRSDHFSRLNSRIGEEVFVHFPPECDTPARAARDNSTSNHATPASVHMSNTGIALFYPKHL